MSNSFEIYKTMVASTAHVEERDFQALEAFPEIFSCEDHYYGTSLYIGSEQGILNEIGSIRISEGLKLLILFALSNGCSWLKLDSDGPIYDDLPHYDW